jgi:hypothetical protein
MVKGYYQDVSANGVVDAKYAAAFGMMGAAAAGFVV